jgi:tetratricopeptide (TPR) repeat protein
MYNLLLALLAGLVTFGGVTFALSAVAAVLPALGAFLVVLFLLSRRTAQLVQTELASVGNLLQQQRVDEAQTKLVLVKQRFGNWQLRLAAQIDAQLGLIEYLQTKFEEAKPLLESGRWRNAPVLARLGLIEWRKGQKALGYKLLEEATRASAEDAMIYVVWAVLKAREGERAEALTIVGNGLKALPGNHTLKELQQKLANDQKVDTKAFGEGWYQYFPEDYRADMLKQHVMRGTRTPSPLLAKLPQPRFGARHAPRR